MRLDEKEGHADSGCDNNRLAASLKRRGGGNGRAPLKWPTVFLQQCRQKWRWGGVNVKQQNTLLFLAAGSLFPDHGGRRTGWREREVLSNCLCQARKAQAGIKPKVPAPPCHPVSHLLSKTHVNPRRSTMHCLAGTSQERDHMMGGSPGVLRWANVSP